MNRVAVIFHRLGPYHWARLSAAATHVDVWAVELSADTSEYAWDKVEAPAPFQRRTLFTEQDSRKASSRELLRRVALALRDIRPDVVAIPGWSDNGAMAALWW